MLNKEYILKITDQIKAKRIEKILSFIHKEYELQVGRSEDDKFHTSADITNIIVPAKNQKDKIAIIAHHDVYTGSLGFNDNSSGVVTLLKLQDSLRDNIELVFTDEEESGGLGCKYYLDNYLKPKEAINVDVVGLGDNIFYEMYGGKVTTYKIPESMEYYKGIPLNDSHMLARYGMPNILMLTGESHEKLIENIAHASHGDKNDNKIEMISEDMMNNVFNTLVTMVCKADRDAV